MHCPSNERKTENFDAGEGRDSLCFFKPNRSLRPLRHHPRDLVAERSCFAFRCLGTTLALSARRCKASWLNKGTSLERRCQTQGLQPHPPLPMTDSRPRARPLTNARLLDAATRPRFFAETSECLLADILRLLADKSAVALEAPWRLDHRMQSKETNARGSSAEQRRRTHEAKALDQGSL